MLIASLRSSLLLRGVTAADAGAARLVQELFDELDAPVKRLCMDDAPVPYASSMEQAVVKRAADLVQGVADIVQKKF